MSVLKQILASVTQIFICVVCSAQRETIDSLKNVLPVAKGIQRINCLNSLSKAYLFSTSGTLYYYIKRDSSLLFSNQAFTEAEKINYVQGMADARYNQGKFKEALREKQQDYLSAISFYQQCNNVDTLGQAYFSLGEVLRSQANFHGSIAAYKNAEQLYRQANDSWNLGVLFTFMGLAYGTSGDFENAFDYSYKALKEREKHKQRDPMGIVWSLCNLGRLFQEVEDYPAAIDYYYTKSRGYAAANGITLTSFFCEKIAECWWRMHQYDSAFYYMTKSLSAGPHDTAALKRRLEDLTETDFRVGQLHLIKNEYDLALRIFFNDMKISESKNDLAHIMEILGYIGEAYIAKGDYGNALMNARKLLKLAQNTGARQHIRDGTKQIWQVYDQLKIVDSAYKYYQQYAAMKDSVSNYRFLSQVTSFKQAAANEKKETAYQQNLSNQAFTKKLLIAGIIVIVFFAVIIIRNIMLKRKNVIRQREILQNELQIQKLEGEKTKAELQKQATELEMQALRATTQEQLMQSEKMASLGELTSGIAHEIKNPLNFINNFSEINMELITEIEEEQIPNLDEKNQAQLASIIKTLKKNSEKINHHGKRVDGIVKGMLQHSRLGNVNKEPIDINSLCDESLKLAWHGFKAKEKSFNASFETRFDPDLPNVMVFPQDLGRVMINLINNAFYAVHEKKKRNQLESSADALQIESLYKPSVIVSTKKNGSKIFITVSDNGMGIPSPIMNKIFQPFFTTKPTGEGTGLGLSMSYDIISKSHGGEIRAKTKEGLGTDFEIVLPVS